MLPNWLQNCSYRHSLGQFAKFLTSLLIPALESIAGGDYHHERFERFLKEVIVMKAAIIGSGISGLTAAYRLHQRHEVVVFEAASYGGGHTNTVDENLDGEQHSIDTGFIVFNDWTYPNFIQMLTELGVASKPTSMSFSVRDDRVNLEYNGESLNSLFAQRRNLLRPRFYRMVADILRFNKHAVRLVTGEDAEATVGEFLARHRYSQEFADRYLLPMGAAIWSCPTGTFSQFPIRFVVEFYRNHGLLSITDRPTWRVIVGGSRNYVRPLTRGFRNQIRLNTPVSRVTRFADRVEVQPLHGAPEKFDHVIFACHSDQALKILGTDASPIEREVLLAFPYERNMAVLHTDASVLPERKRCWASWNYRVHREQPTAATVTYNMNILQGLRSQKTFCVTLNDEPAIDPKTILQRFEYHHPVFTAKRATAQARHADLINVNRTSYCGAYWGNGFHEDGVVSALAVVKSLDPQALPVASTNEVRVLAARRSSVSQFT
jgi:predicted NAD/FAD-binding protein